MLCPCFVFLLQSMVHTDSSRAEASGLELSSLLQSHCDLRWQDELFLHENTRVRNSLSMLTSLSCTCVAQQLKSESGWATEFHADIRHSQQRVGAGVCYSFARRTPFPSLGYRTDLHFSSVCVLKKLSHFLSVAAFMSSQDVQVAQC